MDTLKKRFEGGVSLPVLLGILLLVALVIAVIAQLLSGGAGDPNNQAEPTDTPSVGLGGTTDPSQPPQPTPTIDRDESVGTIDVDTLVTEGVGWDFANAANSMSGDELAGAIKDYSHAGLVETMRIMDMDAFPRGAIGVTGTSGTITVSNDAGEGLYRLMVDDGVIVYLEYLPAGDPYGPDAPAMTPFNPDVKELWQMEAYEAAKAWANYDSDSTEEVRNEWVNAYFMDDSYVAPLLTTDVPGARPRLAIPSDFRILTYSDQAVPDGVIVVAMDAVVYDEAHANALITQGVIAVTMVWDEEWASWRPQGLAWTASN